MRWCWWCCHDFPGEEIHFPIAYDEKKRQYQTFGIFCSWSCVKAFNLDKHGTLRGGIIGQHILGMRKEMCGLSTPIKAAPNRLALKEFGGALKVYFYSKNQVDTSSMYFTGPLSIEEFRKTAGVDVKVHMPYEIKCAVDIHVVTPEEESAPSIAPSSSSAPGNLVLKRPKPLKRHENSLEKSLGIFKK